jgi:hypothetical protein
VEHQAAAGPTEKSTASEDLSPDRIWLAIGRQTSRTLELGQTVASNSKV